MAFQEAMKDLAREWYWRERVYWALVAPYVKKGTPWPAPKRPRILED